MERWERLPNESAKAYKAFCHYRDTEPRDRALARTYREVSNKPSARRASGRFHTWQRLYDWVERAREYDAHKEKLRIAAKETEHLAKFDDYRDRNERLARASSESAIRALSLANTKLEKMMEAKEDIPSKLLPTFMRAIAAVAELASQAEARSIGVDELMRHYLADEGRK
jgi:hypothetical protein